MGMQPYALKDHERSEFVNSLKSLESYELNVLWSLLSLLDNGHDISDLNGVPALLEDLLGNASNGAMKPKPNGYRPDQLRLLRKKSVSVSANPNVYLLTCDLCGQKWMPAVLPTKRMRRGWADCPRCNGKM